MTIIVAIVLLLSPLTSGIAKEADCGNYVVRFVRSSFDGTNTTFTYTLSSLAPPAASHWVLGMGPCISASDIVSAGPGPTVFGTDPTTGVYGVKFDTMVPEGETMTFSVTLSGYWAEGTSASEPAIKAATKAAGTVCYYSTTGPACEAPEADLELSKDVDVSSPFVGSTVTFTVELTNDGPDDASGVEVKDLLPSGLAYESSLASQGTYNAGTGVWSIGSISDNDSETLEITATVLATGSYVNTAEVTAASLPDPDSTPGNNVPSEDDQDSVTLLPIVPQISVNDVTVPEGNTATFLVTLSAASTATVTVEYITSDGTAGQPGDYTLTSGTVTFLPGETSQTVSVPTVEDPIDEPDETFDVNLSSPVNATIADPLGIGTILDDDAAPEIVVSDVTVPEGDTATFTVSLSNPSFSTVTVNYVTSDGTAGQPGDYTLTSGTVTFLPGETSQTVSVPTVEDPIDEPDETFDVNLSSPVNATIADPLGIGTILDDDAAPEIVVSDVTVPEGDTATFTVSLSNPSASTVTVNHGTSDGTAGQPDDYALTSGTVTFLPGETSQTVNVPTIQDPVDEPDETFDVNLSSPVNATIADPLGIGTILDDDAAPQIVVSDVTVPEGDTATFTVSLSNPSSSTVTVEYATSDGTAGQPGDYALTSGTVTFLPGETSKTVNVPTIQDPIDEPDETFDLNLSSPVNATISDPLGIGTILDDDATPEIAVNDVTVPEGDTATFTVSLSNPSSSTVTVNYVTSDGTAGQPDDYALTSGTVTFLPGQTTQTVNVPTVEDPIDEPDETFDVNLSSPVNATIADPLGIGTILDDDAPPQIVVNDVTVPEGDTATFTVSLSNPSSSTVAVNYVTSDGTAGQPGDYALTSGSVTFLPGQTTQTVNVPTVEDPIDEPDETFNLNLSSPVNATIADPLGIGTILDDDAPPQIVVNDVTVPEGDIATFTVSLSNPSASTVTVNYVTSDGTAEQPGDYTLTSGTVTFLPGETSQTVNVPTIQDPIDEPDETFDLNLSAPSNATIADPLGVGTILDDDATPEIAVNDVTVPEGDTATFTVSLSNPSSSTVTVNYVTSDGTAGQPGDYALTSGTVTFLPGETSQTVNVPTIQDPIDEPDETFDVNLSSPVNATIADPLGVGTILDDDLTPTISVDDQTVDEGATAAFTVSLSNPSSSTVTVNYVTSDGTAGQPGDYALTSGTVTFLPGETSQTVNVPTIQDPIDEPDETFNLDLSAPSNATIVDPLGVGTILDDDAAPEIAVDDFTVPEGDTATFTVSLSNPSSSTVTVNYVTSDGTASQPGDYTLTGETVTFLPGETSQAVNVPTIQDPIDEPDETFDVNLSSPVNATIADPLGIGTILDDDAPPEIVVNDVTVPEGDTATFTVSLSNPSSSTVTVEYITSDGTASQPGDYTLTGETVTFLPGETSQTVNVPTIQDPIDEPDETFDVNLSSPVNATIADPLGIGTILDDDATPEIAINDVTVPEGNAATFTVSLSNPSSSTVTVEYITSNGTAQQPGDYTLTFGTVTFLAGQTTQTVNVPTIQDPIDESDETFNLTLSSPSNATISDPLGIGTILDDDAAPEIAVDDFTMPEGDTATFTVSLSNPSASTVTVEYATSDGTAEQPGDYTLASGTVTFLPGQTTQTVNVPSIEDPIDEPDETFDLNLSSSVNATISDPLGIGTILDDDEVPTISVDNQTVNEGDTATFTVSLSNPSSSTVTVNYVTSDGTASQPGDYTLTSGTVTFLPGETSQTVNVPTVEDPIDEPDETFNLNLLSPSNATIADPLGIGTILDGDGAPTISVDNQTVSEGDTGTFTVSLSNPSASTVTVEYSTSDGTAGQPGDYALTSGTVIFLPGQTSQTVNVPTVEDPIDEPDETFNLNLSSPVNATIADPLGIGTILDDDAAPEIAVNDVTVPEGDTATFTVGLSNPSASTVTVEYATSDGTAGQPGDYTLVSGTVTFLPGQTSQTVNVPTVEDPIDEPDETFNLNLSSPVNATVADPLGTGTILDDDEVPTISVEDQTVNEGDTATFTVSLSNPSASTVTVNFITSDDTAVEPGDYTLVSGTVTFLPGETTQPVNVPTIEDPIDEPNETFSLNLSSPSNATITDPLGVGTILDNDNPPVILVDDVSVSEGETATFTVSLSNPSSSTVTVNFITSDGTAGEPGDYTLTSGTVTFLPGETSQSVNVPTVEDPIDEPDETFALNLSAPANATIVDPLGIGTILDDDAAPVVSIDDVGVSEGDTATFTLSLSNPSASTVTVEYITSDGTAGQPGDYPLTSGTVTFLPGETTQTVNVPTIEDPIDEPNETFSLNLSSPSNATITDPLGIGTILDNDEVPTISVDNQTVNEGDTATFTVSLSNPSASTVTVNYITSDGSAGEPSDYALTSGTVTFLPGETTQAVNVPTVEDSIDEPDETFALNLSAPANATIVDPLGIGTILDDDAAPVVSIDDVSVSEGDTATFTLSLSNPSASTVTVEYITSDGTAGQPGDYPLTSGTVTFLPGETTQTVNVPTVEDSIDEPDETFALNLSAPANATIVDPLGIGTILDDDAAPVVSIDDVGVSEGDTATFTLSLSNPSASTVTVEYITSDGTAGQPGDYPLTSGTVTFLPGETTQTVNVPTIEDPIDEPNETFDLNLSSPVNATITDPLGIGTILDDDDPPVISIDDVSVSEGDTAAFIVSLSNPSASTVTVTYGTSDGTAGQPDDYTLTSGTVTFLPGETSQTVTVPTVEDLIDESDETFDLSLSAPANATIADPLGVGTILDDETPGIQITKTGPESAKVGETILYTLIVTNTGDSILSDVTVNDPLTGTSINLGTLAPQETQTLTPSYTVVAGDLPGPLLNTAIADSNETNPESASHEVEVLPTEIDLSLTKTIDNPTPTPGELVTFEIVLSNSPDYDTATGITVTDTLPSGFAFVGFIASQGSYLFTGVQSVWDVGTLAAGESATLQITATVQSEGDTISPVEVSSADQPDVDSTPGNASTANEDDDDTIVILGVETGGGGEAEACEGKIIINEVAWAGTAASPQDEWIELRNLGIEPVDLTGWTLRWRRKNPITPEDYEWSVVPLTGILPGAPINACEISIHDPIPSIEFVKRDVDNISWLVVSQPIDPDDSYLIVERHTDRTVSTTDANVIYDTVEPYTMELHDEGEIIELLDASGAIVDTANGFPAPRPDWPAGNATAFATMERTDPLAPDTAGNWHTNFGITTWGQDADRQPLIATADAVNSRPLEKILILSGVSPTQISAGEKLEVAFNRSGPGIQRPWVTVASLIAAENGGGGGEIAALVEHDITWRVSDDAEWLDIETAGLSEGDYLIWVVSEAGETVLVPITVLR